MVFNSVLCSHCLTLICKTYVWREVIVVLYIYLAVGAQFLDQLGEGAARLVFALACDLTHVQVLQHLLVLFEREDDGCLVAVGVRDELNVSRHVCFSGSMTLRPNIIMTSTRARGRAAQFCLTCAPLMTTSEDDLTVMSW